jgi:hypothetical protein
MEHPVLQEGHFKKPSESPPAPSDTSRAEQPPFQHRQGAIEEGVQRAAPEEGVAKTSEMYLYAMVGKDKSGRQSDAR